MRSGVAGGWEGWWEDGVSWREVGGIGIGVNGMAESGGGVRGAGM